jgi:hypothetical protein
LANGGVLVALVDLSIAAAVWLLSTILAAVRGSLTRLLVEGTVAALMLFAAATSAWSLSRGSRR